MTRRRLSCHPVTDQTGQVIGYGRSAGPLTEADQAAVRDFAAYLSARRAADHPDPDTDPAELDTRPDTDPHTPTPGPDTHPDGTDTRTGHPTGQH